MDDFELRSLPDFSAIAGLIPSLFHMSTVGKLPAAFWKSKHVPAASSLLWSWPSPRRSWENHPWTCSPHPTWFLEGSAKLSRGVFSGALRWPHPLLGTRFLSTLPCTKGDHVDPVHSLSELTDLAHSISVLVPRIDGPQMSPECSTGKTGQKRSLFPHQEVEIWRDW